MYQASWLLPELLEISSGSLDFQEGDKPPVLLAWCPLVARGSIALTRLSRAWSQTQLPDGWIGLLTGTVFVTSPLSHPTVLLICSYSTRSPGWGPCCGCTGRS